MQLYALVPKKSLVDVEFRPIKPATSTRRSHFLLLYSDGNVTGEESTDKCHGKGKIG